MVLFTLMLDRINVNHVRNRSNDQRDLEHHELFHDKPYTCGTCNKGLAVLNSLKEHEHIYTGSKPFKCKTFDKAFRVL